MALLDDDKRKIVDRLNQRIDARATRYEMLDDTYDGLQERTLVGLAVPPELHWVAFPLMWPATCVDANVHRMDVKGFLVNNEIDSSSSLQELWDVNDLEANSELVHNEALIQGLSFVSIGSNEDNPDEPLIVPESSRYLAVETDPRTRKRTAALRVYASSDEFGKDVDAGVLYLPDETIWYQRGQGGLEVIERDQHNAGVVTIVPFINRGRLGAARSNSLGGQLEPMWGRSEMWPVINPTAMAAGVLAALRIGTEISAIPRVVLSGVKTNTFKGKHGEDMTPFQSFLQAIWALEDPQAKAQTISPANLNNFTAVITMLAQQAAASSFLPWEYFGLHTDNPASADAIRANETRLAKLVERRNRVFGAAWGNALAIAERMRGRDVPGNRILTQWHDPGTPTFAQKADGIQKLAGGKPILSREGSWDELGFSPERKTREKQYFANELAELNSIGQQVTERFTQPLAADGVPEPEPVAEPALVADATMGGVLFGKAA